MSEKSKSYKISDKLMNLLVDYFLYDNCTERTHQAIVKELDAKIDAMVKRANYADNLKVHSLDNKTHA